MILVGLNRLKEEEIQLNQEYLKHTNVRSLQTLFVENVFSSMRGGNTVTPTVLDFCLRFPRCTNELLKRVTRTSFNYFTNPKASYYLQPSMKDVLIQFSELAKLPKPGTGWLAPKQMAELRQWASLSPWKKCPSKHNKKFLNQRQAWNTTVKRLSSLVSQGRSCKLQYATARCKPLSKQGERKFW